MNRYLNNISRLPAVILISVILVILAACSSEGETWRATATQDYYINVISTGPASNYPLTIEIAPLET